MIKLARIVSDPKDGYFLAAVYYDTIGSNFESQDGYRLASGVQNAVFRLLNPWYALDNYYSGLKGALFHVYTTKGVFKAVRNDSFANFDVGSPLVFLSNATGNGTDSSYRNDYYDRESTPASVSCASKVGAELTNDKDKGSVLFEDCLDTNELFTVLDPYTLSNNPYFINLYQAKAMLTLEPGEAVEDILGGGPYANLNQSYQTASKRRRELIVTDLHLNWASSPQADGRFLIYRFRPDASQSYPAVAECSNRGLCNTFEGLCECFAGYTGQACGTQSSLVP